MAKLNGNQVIGILVLVALVLMYVSIPLIEGRTIAAILLLLSGLYLLIKG